jgi:hypothetical protein
VGNVGRVAVVAALLVADVGLIVFGLSHFHSKNTPSVPVTLRTPNLHNLLGGPNHKVDAASVTSATKRPGVLISALSNTAAISVMTGCTHRPNFQATLTGGAAWFPVTPPARHILRAQLTGPGTVWAVGADRKCHHLKYYSKLGAGAWTASSHLGHVWVPEESGVRSPRGHVSTPCGTTKPQPVALAAADTKRALVICQLGVFRTVNAGKSWEAAGKLPMGRPASVTLTRHGHGAIVIEDPTGCAGLDVTVTRDGGKTWSKADCLVNAESPAGISLAHDGTGLMLGAGKPYATKDYGKDWK